MDMTIKRNIWIDDIKVFSCTLVVLGHFFQSMVKANILPENDLYKWFNQSIYLFHVQLFFICSGYLYQKYSRVNTIRRWCENISKKAISLGIPYLAFSTITWFLKTAFSGSVNGEIGGLFETLFLVPTAPYWFLYTLFFLFLLTPTFSNEKIMLTVLCIAVILKFVNITGCSTNIYAIDTVFNYGVWFVFGMIISRTSMDVKLAKRAGVVVGTILAGIFLAASIYIYFFEVNFLGMTFLLGLLACVAVILMAVSIFRDSQQYKLLGYLARYTMPIFLMHTIFAAPVRIVMLKLGVESAFIHTVVGLIISFAGPIAAAEVMKYIKWLDVFLYPNKYIRLNYGTFYDKKSDSSQNTI